MEQIQQSTSSSSSRTVTSVSSLIQLTVNKLQQKAKLLLQWMNEREVVYVATACTQIFDIIRDQYNISRELKILHYDTCWLTESILANRHHPTLGKLLIGKAENATLSIADTCTDGAHEYQQKKIKQLLECEQITITEFDVDWYISEAFSSLVTYC